jgi:hypothetical protein
LWIDSLEHNEAIVRKRWSAALASGQLKLQRAFITADDINDLIASNGFSGEIDLLSVDIDFAAGKFAEPFTAENHYHPPRYYLTHGFISGHLEAGEQLI